jgi:hypothetical protein
MELPGQDSSAYGEECAYKASGVCRAAMVGCRKNAVCPCGAGYQSWKCSGFREILKVEGRGDDLLDTQTPTK